MKEGENMEISFVLDVASVWVGVGLTLLAEVILMFVLAGAQYRKKNKKGARRL